MEEESTRLPEGVMTDQTADHTDPTSADIATRGVCAYAGHSTSVNGAPVRTEEHSVTVGEQGPISLTDMHLIEKHAHFNRERIPERNVHAKGTGAFGELTITEDVTAYTKADLFQPGRVTPMLARFRPSPVSRASPTRSGTSVASR